MTDYRPIDRVFAILTVLLAFLWQRVVFFRAAGGLAVNVTVMTALTVLLFAAYLILCGKKNIKILLFLIPIGGSAVFLLYDGGPRELYLLFCGALAVFCLAECCGTRGSAAFILPFSKFFSIFRALFQPCKKKRGQAFAWAALGLLGCLPVFSIAAALLSSDAAFDGFVHMMTTKLFYNAFWFFIRLLFCVPLAMYLFGAMFSNVRADVCKKTDFNPDKLRVAPVGLAYGFLSPLALLYVAYFFSQLSYFTSAFSSVLPSGYSYAEYARSGFFELCAVSAVNLIIILCVGIFSQKGRGVQVLTIIMSVLTLGLLVTAMSKMLMYIGNCQLTRLRVYTLFFMIALAIAFILIIVRTIFKQVPAGRIFLISASLLFSVFMFCNTDGIIARYNVRTYMAGQYEKIDVQMLRHLSDDAVPYLYELTTCADPQIAQEAQEALSDRAARRKARLQKGCPSFNFSSAAADKIYSRFEDFNSDMQ